MCDEGEGKIAIDGKGVSRIETIRAVGSEGILAMRAISTPLRSASNSP